MDEIVTSIRTTQDRDKLVDDIAEFEKAQFVDESKRQMIYDSIDRKNLDILNSINLVDDPEILKKLREKILGLEVVIISISFEPSERTIESVASWVRDNFGPDTVVQFDIDKEIGAGAVVSYKGKYAAFTVEDRLEEYIKQNKRHIIDTIKKGQGAIGLQ